MNGAIAGAVATLFHTAVMFALHQRLSRAARAPLPPVEITSEVVKRAGINKLQHGAGLTVATIATHFGYGAAAGMLYAPIAARLRQKHIGAGIAYGIIVWVLSYLGWIPGTSHSAASDAPARPAKRHDGSGSRCVGRRTCGYVRAITATMTARRTRPHVLKSAKTTYRRIHVILHNIHYARFATVHWPRRTGLRS